MELVTQLEPSIRDQIVYAFSEYLYEPGEENQFSLFKSQAAQERYLQLYVEYALKNRFLYTYEKKGYIMLTENGQEFGFFQQLHLVWMVARGMGFMNLLTYFSMSAQVDPALTEVLSRKNCPTLHIEMVCVLPRYQRQGILRKILKECRAQAEAEQRILYLETDSLTKSQRYTHLGMTLVKKRPFSRHFIWYDFIQK